VVNLLVWELSDIQKTGALNVEEFALALYLSEVVKKGEKIPNPLPINFIPPSRLKFYKQQMAKAKQLASANNKGNS